MSSTSVHCPSCGAPLEFSGAAAIVVCQYCETYSAVAKEGLSQVGKVAPLVAMPSALELHRELRLDGRSCTITGRVRYEYEDGLWDEWNLLFDDGSVSWLHEDEGDLTLYTRRETGPAHQPSMQDLAVRAGSTLEAFGHRIFATESGVATPIGAEGEVYSALHPGVRFGYVDGVEAGKQYIVLASAQGSVLFEGRTLDHGELAS